MSEPRNYIRRIPQGMKAFTVNITLVRYGGNVCGLALHPGIMMLEANPPFVAGACCATLHMTRFEYDSSEDGFVVAGIAIYVSWWRRSAPDYYQRREYGGPGGWPSPEECSVQKYNWLGFRPARWR